jgi:type II secretory pathway component PulL
MIGFIDWTEKNLTVYIFQKEGREYILTDTRSLEIEGALERSLVESLIDTPLEHIYLSVPMNLLTFRELSFPFSDDQKIHDTASYELEGILLGSINDYAIDCIVKESFENETHALAVCIEKQKLQGILELFLSAGLDPVVITSLDAKFLSKNIKAVLEGSPVSEEMRMNAAEEELQKPTINLRQDEFKYKGDIERFKKALRITSLLLLVLLSIISVTMVVKHMHLKKEKALIVQEINRTYLNTFQDKTKIVDAVRQFKGNLNVLKEKKEILGGIPVLDILLDIANHKQKDMLINECNLEENNIIIKGTALTFEHVDTFKNVLQSSYADVRVVDSKSSPDKKIDFTIIMKRQTA